ncbi:hypothetical protein D3C72_528780 [compost metagenome]
MLYAFLVGIVSEIVGAGGVYFNTYHANRLRIPTWTTIASFDKLAVHKSSIVLDHGTGTVGVRIHEESVSRKVIMA